MAIIQNNVNFIDNKPIQNNQNLTSDIILYKFNFNSTNIFEKKGKLILSFLFKFTNINIEIYSITKSGLKELNKIINYQNMVYIFDTEITDFYVKIITEDKIIHERKIFLNNTLNCKSSNIGFLPFKYYGEKLENEVLKFRAIHLNKITINYLSNFKKCCIEHQDKKDKKCEDHLGTLYFSDNENKVATTKANIPINWLAFEDFNNKEFIKDKMGRFAVGLDNIKWGSRYKCAYSYYDIYKEECLLRLSPIEHYKFVDNILNLVTKLIKNYPNFNRSNLYRFLFNNPYLKSNDLIIEIENKE